MSRTRAVVLIVIVFSLGACKWLPKRRTVQDAGVDGAAVAITTEADASADAAPGSKSIAVNDLPQGFWDSTEGSKSALTILPDGLVRFATEVPSYRNPARVFGHINLAEANDANPNQFQIFVDVTKIYAKEIGPQHRRWADFELFEAEILGQRVTSPNQDAQKIPALGGKGPEAERGYALDFSADRTTLKLCTLTTPPTCKTLTKKKSPSDFSRVRTNGLCKVDDDCVVVTDGEQCDPCLCPSRPSLKSWPRVSKPNDEREDLSWERTQEHLCGKDIPRREDCPVCPTLRAQCKHQACVLRTN